jgi:hypothetical protein
MVYFSPIEFFTGFWSLATGHWPEAKSKKPVARGLAAGWHFQTSFDSPISFRYVYLRCKVCSQRFPVNHFCDTLDEDFETALGNFPCGRL